MDIKIISHPFHGFVPIECKSLFLDVKTTPDKLKGIMREIYSDDMQLFSMVMYGKIQEKEEDEEQRIPIYKLMEDTKRLNEKYIEIRKCRNRKMYDEMLTYRNYLTKDTMKLVADEWLRHKEKELKKGKSEIVEWKVLAAEILQKVERNEEMTEFYWKVFPIEELMMSLVKLLYKTLSRVLIKAWLYTGENIRLSLRKDQYKNNFFVYLECPKGELFEKCKSFITTFLHNYIE